MKIDLDDVVLIVLVDEELMLEERMIVFKVIEEVDFKDFKGDIYDFDRIVV